MGQENNKPIPIEAITAPVIRNKRTYTSPKENDRKKDRKNEDGMEEDEMEPPALASALKDPADTDEESEEEGEEAETLTTDDPAESGNMQMNNDDINTASKKFKSGTFSSTPDPMDQKIRKNFSYQGKNTHIQTTSHNTSKVIDTS